MHESVLFLYGPHEDTPEHPFRDKMLNKRGLLQGLLAEADVQVDIGYVIGDIKTDDSTPENVLVAKNPQFDKDGDITHMKLEPGHINEYTLVLDHFVNGFRHKRMGSKGEIEEFAAGIGRDLHTTINHNSIQRFGDDKKATEDLITAPLGLSLQGYNFDDLEAFRDNWGNGGVVFKPLSGALSKGIVIFDSYDNFMSGKDNLPQTGVIQPFVDCTEPFANLKALHPEYAAKLHELNSNKRHVREVRMHTTISTSLDGERTIKTVPSLRIGEADNPIMKNWTFIPLDPDYFADAYPNIQQAAQSVGEQFANITGASHMYFVSDISVARHKRFMRPRILANDVNCRMPRLPGFETSAGDLITPAQRNFANMLISGVTYAKQYTSS